MGKAVLVEPDIADGKRLVQELDRAAITVTAAVWLFPPDASEWVLLIALRTFDAQGPRKSYATVGKVLKRLQPPSSLSLQDLSVVGPRNQWITLLGSAIKTGPGISGIRFSRNVINGILIPDAYIYRLT